MTGAKGRCWWLGRAGLSLVILGRPFGLAESCVAIGALITVKPQRNSQTQLGRQHTKVAFSGQYNSTCQVLPTPIHTTRAMNVLFWDTSASGYTSN